jgi:hypothetical protein
VHSIIAALTIALAVPPRVVAPEGGSPAPVEVPAAATEALARADAAVTAGDEDAALAALREAFGHTTEAHPKLRRDILHGIGNAERRRFDATGDLKGLRRAVVTLADAAERCTDPLDPVCPKIDEDLQQARVRLEQEESGARPPSDPVTPVGPATPPGPEAPSAPVAVATHPTHPGDPGPPSAPRPVDSKAEMNRQLRTADGLAVTGYVLLAIGGVTLVVVSLPAIVSASIAQDRAEGDPLLVSVEELEGRAARRRRIAAISALVGGGFVIAGVAFMGAGLGKKAAIRKRAEAQASAMLLPGGAGAALRVRF